MLNSLDGTRSRNAVFRFERVKTIQIFGLVWNYNLPRGVFALKESPLFAKSYDFVRWLIPHTIKFPREQRFVVAQRLQSTALDFMEHLYQASGQSDPLIWLKKADSKLKQLRFYLRLSHDLRLLDTRRFEHACRQIEEMGRLLGAWIKKSG